MRIVHLGDGIYVNPAHVVAITAGEWRQEELDMPHGGFRTRIILSVDVDLSNDGRRVSVINANGRPDDICERVFGEKPW